MGRFKITINGKQAEAEQAGEKNYILYKEGGDIHLLVKQDNDGANRWLDTSTDNETAESKEAGKAIETYLANKNSEQFVAK